MPDAQGAPAAPADHSGQQFVEALKFLTTDLPVLSILVCCRCYVAAWCLREVLSSKQTELCCGMAFIAAWWAMGLFAHAMISVLLRLFWIFGKINSVYRKVDTAVIVFCALWNGAGLFYALALASNDARALRFAMLFGGCSTLFAYTAEVYIFYWRLIPFREDLYSMVQLFTVPRSSALPKRGSLKCCTAVEFNEFAAVEEGRLRTCAICLDEIHACGKVRKTPCGHFFHESCLQGWFIQGAFCPLCRADCSSPTSPQRDTSAADM
jgi:hypothetical protein